MLVKGDKLAEAVHYLHNTEPERSSSSLKAAFAKASPFLLPKLNEEERQKLHLIMGSAHMLYVDVDEALKHMMHAKDKLGLG